MIIARHTKQCKRSQNYEPTWSKRFGLFVAARDPNTSRVVCVGCQFCATFGREQQGRARQISTFKCFKPPYRTDNFLKHVRSQHSNQWTAFQASTPEQQGRFFDVDVPFVETINAHFGKENQAIKLSIAGHIVDNVVKGMLLENGDHSVSLGNMFKFDISSSCYVLTVKEMRCMNVVMDQVSIGLSFRETCRSLLGLRSTCHLPFLSAFNEQQVGKYVQAATAICLQKISDMLQDDDCWCYSVAFDGATNRGDSYLDVRVRFCRYGDLVNYHILAIPFDTSHTGQNMYESLSVVLKAILGDKWIGKMIGAATDGAANMTGRHSGAVTRLQRISKPGFYRVWCGAHQLDLVVQEVMGNTLKEMFYDPLTTLIAYLRRQHNLRAEMGTTCPKVASTRWLSLGNVTKWLVSNRVGVNDYLQRIRPASAPSIAWWVLLFVVHNIMVPIDVCFKSVQGQDTLLQEQNIRFEELASSLKGMGSIAEPFTGIEFLSFVSENDIVKQDGTFVVTRSGVIELIESCGSIVATQFHMLVEEDQASIVFEVAEMLLGMYNGVCNLCTLRRVDNAPDTALPPPVLPAQLLKLTARQFFELVSKQRERLLLTKCEQYIEDLEQEFVEFKRSYSSGSLPASLAVDPSVHGGKWFDRAWHPVGARFSRIRAFSGGLATVFPGTATVEADFSTINREANSHRSALTDLSLEGILHARQWKDICRRTVSK